LRVKRLSAGSLGALAALSSTTPSLAQGLHSRARAHAWAMGDRSPWQTLVATAPQPLTKF